MKAGARMGRQHGAAGRVHEWVHMLRRALIRRVCYPYAPAAEARIWYTVEKITS